MWGLVYSTGTEIEVQLEGDTIGLPLKSIYAEDKLGEPLTTEEYSLA